jgi:GTP-binding protein EngB required for normal cell division
MMAWLAQAKIPTLVALTKTDKIGRNQLRALVATYREKWIEDPDWKIVATSAEKKEGREDLLEGVERFLSAHQKRSIRRAAEAKVERKT